METDLLKESIIKEDSRKLIERIRNDFLGLKTKYRIANGKEIRRIYKIRK